MRTLWMDPEEADFPALEGGRDADVCIIGAGFSGIGAAWALRPTGAGVVVLEERTVASGATGRNAGFVLAGPAMAYEETVRTLGREATREIWQLTRQNNATLARTLEELELECGYVRRGSMSLAASEGEWESMQRSCAGLREDGVEVCAVPATELPRPFDRLYRGGIYYAGNAEIQPACFVRGVARALPPGTVYERSAVTVVTPAERGWQVETGGGRVRAPAVILATNAYSRRLLPDVPIVPTRGQVLSTVPLEGVVIPFPMYADRGYQYWRQTPEGRIVAGGWRNLDLAGEVGEEEELHGPIQTALARFLAATVQPSPPIDHRWAGIMGFTPDMAPLVGAVPGLPGLWMAAGYSGHGVAMAFTCGARVALRAIGRPAGIPAAFSPDRFGAGPGPTRLRTL